MRKCQLAVAKKENIVAGGTIVRECGPNYLVVVDALYEPNTALPIPIHSEIATIGTAIGYEVLWPAHLVILSAHPAQVKYFFIFTYSLISIICVRIKHNEMINLFFFYRKSRN